MSQDDAVRPHRGRQRLAPPVAILLAGLLPAALGAVVYRQGFHLLHDGSWLLGTQVLAEGGTLYRDLTTPYGPARYLLLLPFAWLTGKSAYSLVLLRTAVTGIAAALGHAHARREGRPVLAWLVPVGVMALGPLEPQTVLAAALAWLTERALASPSSRRRAVVAVAWGLLTTFGLRGFASGACIVVLAVILGPRPLRQVRTMLPTAAGPAVALAALLVASGITGSLGPGIHDAVLWPLSDLSDRFRGGSPSAWLAAFQVPERADVPFAGIHTGEELAPAWRGHAAHRAASMRVLLLLPWATSLLALVLRRQAPAGNGETARRGPGALALALTACAGLLLRPDRAGFELAWLASLWLMPRLVSLPSTAAVRWLASVIVLAAGFGPLLAEELWLARHAGRPGLERWSRPRAGIDLAHERIANLESTFAAVANRLEGRPALIWPTQPGLHALMEVPPATRQVVLLPHSVYDAAGVVTELETTRPAVAFLGMDTSYARRLLRDTAPPLWSYLRHHYAVMGNVVDRPDEFRVLRRALGGYAEILQLPLPERLPQVELGVANDLGPAMREGITVGQTILVQDTDLSGIAVRWKTSGRTLTFPVRVRIWQRRSQGYTALLEFLDVEVTIPRSLDRSYIRFPQPLADTAGKDLAVTLELREDTADEVRLLWHRHDAGEADVDLYPGGTAVLNLEPVEADLYFIAY